MGHTTSNPKIRTVPASTPEDLAAGQAIVTGGLGPQFWLEFGWPRNVGVKGDAGVWGETVVIVSDDALALTALHKTAEAQDGLARVSNEITNVMAAVTRVLVDIEPQSRPPHLTPIHTH